MKIVTISEREMTSAEFARMNAGFDEHTVSHGNPVEIPERHGFVVMEGETFVGCSSGLAYRHGDTYKDWFYLTDLFIEESHRGRGLGASVLGRLEGRVSALGIRNIWTWTAGYESPGFYLRQGYQVMCELENYYASGHGRVAFRKALGP